MTLAEREYLESALKSSPSTLKKWKEGAENALVIWAASTLIFVLVWAVIIWLVHFISDGEIGLGHSISIGVLIIGIFVCVVYAVYSSVKWVKEWGDHRPLLEADLAKGEVSDENYHIVDVKRFQEPEHGGLIYFLLMDNNRVLVLYDHQSVELSLNEDDPFSSSFQPCYELNIVRAPMTNYFITQKFSGEVINIEKTFELLAPLDQWPEQESWCDIPWNELEKRLETQ